MKTNNNIVIIAGLLCAAVMQTGCTTDDMGAHTGAIGGGLVGTALAPGIGTIAGAGFGAIFDQERRDSGQDAFAAKTRGGLAEVSDEVSLHRAALNTAHANNPALFKKQLKKGYDAPSCEWMEGL